MINNDDKWIEGLMSPTDIDDDGFSDTILGKIKEAEIQNAKIRNRFLYLAYFISFCSALFMTPWKAFFEKTSDLFTGFVPNLDETQLSYSLMALILISVFSIFILLQETE